MRFFVAAALGLGLVPTAAVAQAPKQLQVFAGIVDGSGKPVESLRGGGRPRAWKTVWTPP